MIGSTEILALPCQLSADFVQHLAGETLLANRLTLTRMIHAAGGSSRDALVQQAKDIKPLAGSLYALGLARQNGSHRKMLVYLNCINIFSHHSEIAENREGELVAREGLDIVANEVAVHSQPDADRFSARLAQGILDTNAEAMVLTGCSDGGKPAEISARAAMLGQNLSVIRSPRDGAWQSAKLPEDVRARMEQDLQGGYWVVFGSQNAHDKQDGRFAWWRFDPTTGQILGMGERGWGQVSDEMFFTLVFASQIAFIDFLICLGKKSISQGGAQPTGLDTFNYAIKGLAAGLAFVVAGGVGGDPLKVFGAIAGGVLGVLGT